MGQWLNFMCLEHTACFILTILFIYSSLLTALFLIEKILNDNKLQFCWFPLCYFEEIKPGFVLRKKKVQLSLYTRIDSFFKHCHL